MKLGAIAILIGMALSLSACDKCGHPNFTGFGKTGACSDVKPS